MINGFILAIKNIIDQRKKENQERAWALSNENIAFYDADGHLAGYNRSADANGEAPPLPPLDFPPKT